jgi:hypothetical protein
MSFNGTEGSPIDLNTAADLTANYRNANPNGLKARFFGKDILNQILAQDGCMGIRIYFGLDAANEAQLVIVGADANENDQINGIVGDRSFPCPSFCSSANVLNS